MAEIESVGGVSAAYRVPRPRFSRAVAMILPLAAMGLAAPSAAVTYIGSAGILRGNLLSGATTEAPASYSVADGGASATSMTSNANGGTVMSTSNAGPGFSPASGRAGIQFAFTIAGAENVIVPVHVKASGWAKGGGDTFSSYASFRLDSPGAIGVFKEISVTTADRSDKAFAIDEIVYLTSNYLNNVSIWALASSGQFGNYTGWSEAFVDPVFTIDAAFADRFTLVGLLQDDQPTSPAPEPAAWATMILGFGAIGAMMRRRPRTIAVRFSGRGLQRA